MKNIRVYNKSLPQLQDVMYLPIFQDQNITYRYYFPTTDILEIQREKKISNPKQMINQKCNYLKTMNKVYIWIASIKKNCSNEAKEIQKYKIKGLKIDAQKKITATIK